MRDLVARLDSVSCRMVVRIWWLFALEKIAVTVAQWNAITVPIQISLAESQHALYAFRHDVLFRDAGLTALNYFLTRRHALSYCDTRLVWRGPNVAHDAGACASCWRMQCGFVIGLVFTYEGIC